MSTVDPYPLVLRLVAETAASGGMEAVTPRQMGEAAACFAAGIAALGLELAVAGEATHPAVLRGRWLLLMLREYELPRAVAEGGGRR